MVAAPEVRCSSMEGTTNTLIVTRVPPALLHPSVSPPLREFFERSGHIEAWVPLTAFDRVVVVFSNEQAAEDAKQAMDFTLVEGFGGSDDDVSKSLLRVYRGNPTPLDIVRNRRLRNRLDVPQTDKNFLISPPGSPPVGWEQVREDPPNLDTLANDLVRALESLSVGGGPSAQDDDTRSSGRASPVNNASNNTPPRDTIIIPHRRTDSGDLPSVMVSNMEVAGDTQSSGTHGLSIAEAFALQRSGSLARTPAPGPISQVKATVESMQASSFPHTTVRIDRTPRPPISEASSNF